MSRERLPELQSQVAQAKTANPSSFPVFVPISSRTLPNVSVQRIADTTTTSVGQAGVGSGRIEQASEITRDTHFRALYASIEMVRSQMTEIRSNIHKIAVIHSQILSEPFLPDSSSHALPAPPRHATLATLTSHTTDLSHTVRNTLTRLDREIGSLKAVSWTRDSQITSIIVFDPAGRPSPVAVRDSTVHAHPTRHSPKTGHDVRMYVNVHSHALREFVDLVKVFREQENRFSTVYRDKLDRQHRLLRGSAGSGSGSEATVSGDILAGVGGSQSDVELPKIRVSGLDHGQLAYSTQDITSTARDESVDETKEIRALEKTIGDLSLLFTDVTNLLALQTSLVEDIEISAEQAATATHASNAELRKAVGHALYVRRWKWALVMCAVIAAVVVVLVLVFTLKPR
ncbi:hypothetical protein M427DRAFT_68888 [Gonapodya prolifera JEL478]|uniref:t-SNARE coiled-coil homology domain-containing protein n=1 Tax=Gonapodya prolifera (strain JEL478) TaxID=1344416 RepID=A0A139AJB7_GONPJ|nr:hypothetical protein M427DRAFT_68888 [Gonapodya prolifera JEL478]|eukprot:KXS16881.1 hypothetical protein M427DRAFT_68888 [Gonapodya prolifera JEL478]